MSSAGLIYKEYGIEFCDNILKEMDERYKFKEKLTDLNKIKQKNLI